MMKKFLISLLMLLLSWCMFPQTYHKVTYSKVFNGDTIQSFLVFNSKQALSFRKKTERHHENKTKIVYNQSGDPKLNVHKKDNLHYDYSIDLGGSIRLNKKFEDSLFYSVPKSRKKDTYVAKGRLPKIDWNIRDDKKKILGYTCQKATTTYKCRDYTVWFARELPFPYGPWELQGLPGLILEVEESNGIYTVHTKRIEKTDGSAFKAQLENLKKITKSMSIQKAEELKKEAPQRIKKAIQTMKLPKGATMNSTTITVISLDACH